MGSKEFDIKTGVTSGLEWAMIRLPKTGEKECGDVHLIEKYRDKALLAVIDGLGHGVNAARASNRAKYLIKKSNKESIINIVTDCHQKLKKTRGVVMSLALVDSWEQTVSWTGVGNVSGVLIPVDNINTLNTERILLRNGIVGYKLPALKASVLPIKKGDILVFSTDGVKNGFTEQLDPAKTIDGIAKYIANNYFKKSDDALILAARFIGEDVNEET